MIADSACFKMVLLQIKDLAGPNGYLSDSTSRLNDSVYVHVVGLIMETSLCRV
jgi:hypothetical protein